MIVISVNTNILISGLACHKPYDPDQQQPAAAADFRQTDLINGRGQYRMSKQTHTDGLLLVPKQKTGGNRQRKSGKKWYHVTATL